MFCKFSPLSCNSAKLNGKSIRLNLVNKPTNTSITSTPKNSLAISALEISRKSISLQSFKLLSSALNIPSLNIILGSIKSIISSPTAEFKKVDKDFNISSSENE